MRIVKALSRLKHVPLMVMRVVEAPVPMIATFFETVIVDDHVADPAGTATVSPDAAAATQSRTSAQAALAATRVGLDPLHAASAAGTEEDQKPSATMKPASQASFIGCGPSFRPVRLGSCGTL